MPKIEVLRDIEGLEPRKGNMSVDSQMRNVPKSPFGRRSTAEEVTAGLDLSGKTALITGCNSGLGLETMRVLALRGAQVIGAARSLEAARAACGQVKGNTRPIACELTDLDSIVRCAEEVASSAAPLDMLICNAGIMMLPKLEQIRGLEKQFATNHIGHFLLVNRLLARVMAAPQGRIVMLSSTAHTGAPKAGIEFDNLSGTVRYRPIAAYGQSKLANILFTVALARRLGGTAATVNALHPGVINTNLARHLSPVFGAMFRLLAISPMFKSIPQGAATTCYVATAPLLATTSGIYFSDCNPKLPSQAAGDGAMAERLWSVSKELVKGYL
jgi:NAD(P)-dependent dehydrogenase (short-subunit alcohol dehydrogenase family)